MPDSSAATREDLHLIRMWLREADNAPEPHLAGRIMKPREKEALRRIIGSIEVRDAGA